MKRPVNDARITSPFGYRTDPITKKPGSFHDGVDLISNSGDKSIIAVADGIITYIFNKYNPLERWDLAKESAAGNYLIYEIVLNGVIYFVKPLHFEKMNEYKVGDKVSEGDKLGEYGDVGYSKGAHTHIYTYNSSWNVINPEIVFGKI